MEKQIADVFHRAKSWAVDGQESGWLRQRDVDRFDRIDQRSPSNLFGSQDNRPLVVAFFGGTGVGKSTLLNRLAGHEIARTGVVRPTSREISLYLHRSLELDQLPDRFPVEKVRLDRHHNDEMRNILWVDMPDIDSTEKNNREIVLQWLPHIDALLYVVSPERYQDEKGWRLLLTEGSRHAWIFIMNQFDKADSLQLEAFSAQLRNAGFKDPIVLATDCSDDNPSNQDDFNQLKTTILNLAKQHTVEQLEFRSFASRLESIRDTVRGCIDAMGNSEAIDRNLKHWERIWKNAAVDLSEGLQWPLQQIAPRYGTAGPGGGRKRIGQSAEPSDQQPDLSDPLSTQPFLWDDWAQTRLNDALDELSFASGSSGIPVLGLNKNLQPVRSQAANIVHAQAEQSLRRALANPGHTAQRFLLKLMRICMVLLPLAAISWVAYEILNQFHASSVSGEPYLGINFAIHALLMIGVAWLLPWFIYRKAKPSLEKVALLALKNGVGVGLEVMKSKLDENLQCWVDERTRLIRTGEAITTDCENEASSHCFTEDRLLSRTLPTKHLGPDSSPTAG